MKLCPAVWRWTCTVVSQMHQWFPLYLYIMFTLVCAVRSYTNQSAHLTHRFRHFGKFVGVLYCWIAAENLSPHTFPKSDGRGTASTIFCKFLKPTIWWSHSLHAVIGRMCAGDMTDMTWASVLTFLFLQLLLNLYITHSRFHLLPIFVLHLNPTRCAHSSPFLLHIKSLSGK